MIGTRLILFEGIAGSGKTTTAQWLYLTLMKAGVETEWITEAQKDHPVFRREIEEARTTDEAIERAMDNWRRFADDCAVSPRVSIMDGSLFDSPMSFLLLRDTPSERIGFLVSDIVKALKALRPVLFYFYQDEIGEALEKISTRRGEGWRQHLIAYVSSSLFARNRNLSGMDATRAYYLEYRRIADLLFQQLDIEKTAMSTSGDCWEAYRATIIESLNVSSAVRLVPEKIDLSGFSGDYRDADHDQTWRIVSRDGFLVLEGDARMKLLHVEGDRFLIEGQPIELRFERSGLARAEKIHYLSKARDGLKSELTWIRV